MSNNINKLSGLSSKECVDCNSAQLQHREELCLSAFVDGECGWIKKIFARRKLLKSFEARRFVDELERTSTEIQRSYIPEIEHLGTEVSLWPKISARIAQEERLTLLRSIPIDTPSPFSWMLRLSWSGLGAVAASAIFLLYLPNIQAPQSGPFAARPLVANSSVVAQLSDVRVVAANGSEDVKRFEENNGLQTASLAETSFEKPSRLSEDDYRALQLAAMQGSGAGHNQDQYAWKFIQQEPRFIDNQNSEGLSLPNQRKVIAPQAFEVDWVRSNGRVRLLQDSGGKSAMLWVNRPQNVPAAVQARSANLVQVGNR